jgi:type II secretory pathway pseudopilin PulG
VIVLTIIGILAVLLFPAADQMKGRAQRIQCIANLRNLHVAASLYVQQNNLWPQINVPANQNKTPEEMASLWIAALQPFGLDRRSWVCPTIQNMLHDPDYSTPETARVDYMATSFDDKPTSPYRWPTQPWFVETGDVHGNGNLIIFTDGSVQALNDVSTE